MRVLQTAFYSTLLCGMALSAQTPPTADVSGNGQLKGAYNFRQVLYSVADSVGNLSQERALYGSITFDGNGTYTLTGSVLDSNAATVAPAAYSVTGTYGISASGQGTISGPLSSADLIYGLVANGIFVGSSTQSSFTDMFIATPAAPSPSSVSAFNGAYWIANLDWPTKEPSLAQSAWFELSADGNGGIGTVTVNGHVASSATTTLTQTLQNVTYSFANGVGTLALPVASTAPALAAGNKVIYLSPDGGFVFGGSATGWDMFVGVRTAVPPGVPFSGLRYQAGLDMDVSGLANGSTTLAGYYGALNTAGTQTIGHQHLNSLPISTPYDYTYEDTYTLNSDGTYSDPILGATYIVGSGGMRIGFDVGTALGINVAIPPPALTGTGVFLNPEGIISAASSAPFTAGIAPGEFITLYGSGLGPVAQGATTLPISTTLGNVQVTINGVAAPVAYVSPTAISAIVPYSLTGSIAMVQVINNSVPSNSVTTYLRTTTPGVFTAPASGLGYGAVQHLDYSLMTPANPAHAGETLIVYVSGLGQVTPAVAVGAAGPVTPLSLTASQISVIVDDQVATVSYAGLAPDLAGVYQINFQVPASGIHSGDVYLAIAGPDSLTSEARLSIAAGPGAITPAATKPSLR